MGPAGAGKTTVGRRLAGALGVPFVDGDDFHTPEAIARMRGGHPLDDAARGPWLDRLHEVLRAHHERGIVLACSALRRSYRSRLVGDLSGVAVLALVVAPDVLEARLATRTGHYAGPGLLASQLETLELDGVTDLDGAAPVDDVVAEAQRVLEG
ncbi:MAG: gluconokinase, GntK/IdnK-type [Acidimicrobiia bacterium]|nr:gluconokinase, GntK/IdnK-type [Acidimicrobiia bacterium]